MAILVVGSVAFDSIETPSGHAERCLGGAATYFSLAASYFTDVRVIAVVGEDFTAAEEDVLAAAKKAHEETLAYVRSPVGDIVSPINTYFALVADDPCVQLVNAAQLWYVKRLIAATPALAGLPILSAAAPFKSGGRGGPDYYTDVKAGPIAIKDVADIYLYPNTIRVVKITGGTSSRRSSRSNPVIPGI